MSQYDFSPSQLKKELIDVLPRRLVPFVQSAPGLGKSAIAAEIAEEFNLKLVDIRLSQCTPEDLMGLPMRVDDGTGAPKASFVPFNMFPCEDTPLPEGKDGWLIFLDEFNSAPRGVLSAAYKVVYDGMVGMQKLHTNTLIMLAGNRDEDNAITTNIGTALQSRVVHYTMRPELKDFTNHAYKAGFDNRVMGFLEFQPNLLHDFDPDHHDHTFPCPRTWEFVSRYIKGKSFDDINVAGLAGIISDGAAVSFYAFLKEYNKLPTFSQIFNDPEKTKVPTESGTQFAVISMLIAKYDENNFVDVVKYVKRLSPEMQIVFFRGAFAKNKSIRKHPKFRESQKHLTEFIYDDDDDSLAA